ncbi:MAG: adenylyltransferase/cytidyltransferase family protein [bacterium]|nr:adenylyltransferase/cytidyltransferase family protein [bacterium]
MKPKAKNGAKKINKRKIVFANGVFDIVHKGHIDLLKFAKSLGEKLVVAVNSDRSTKALKGPGRPINNERDRKAFLEMLGLADEVVIFDELNTEKIILKIQPDIVVKGNEWPMEELRKKDNIPTHIEIVLAPLTINPEDSKKYSTTDIIKKIKGVRR